MKQIDEARLETDLGYRFGYLAEFMGFGPDDIAAIHAAAPAPGPARAGAGRCRVRQAARPTTPRSGTSCRGSPGYDGPVPPDVEHLTQDHPQIALPQAAPRPLLVTASSRSPTTARWSSTSTWSARCTRRKAGSTELDVPLVQMNALLGFVADALTATILGLGLDRDERKSGRCGRSTSCSGCRTT